MKILQVIHSFPPYTTAGSEVYTYNLSTELAKKHEVSIFHRINDRYKKEYEAFHNNFNGLDIYTINNTFRLCNSFEMIYDNDIITKKFADILDEIKPDIVHIQHLLFLSTTIVKEIKCRDIPIIYTLHDYWLICPQGQLLKRNFKICNTYRDLDCVDCQVYQLSIKKGIKKIYCALYKIMPDLTRFFKKIYLYFANSFLLSSKNAIEKINTRSRHIKSMCDLVDVFIAPSQFLRQKFINSGIINPAKIIFSPYGFNRKLFENLKKTDSNSKIRFAYIGTLLPHKGVDVLIKAFNRINSDRVELNIYGKLYPYVGFEYYPRYLKKLAKNKNIKFRRSFDNDNIANIFANTDVLIVPSIWPENSPLVIHEAFLAKTPVIASDIGGNPELVSHNVNGLLFRANDEKGLYNKIKLIIDRPTYIDELSQNTPAIKTIEENTEELEKIYTKLTG
jgi:glycosyltransferase involved in cell wall biosynthesis